MAVHTVYITPTPVLDGTVINKNTATIAEVMRAETEMRILPDAGVPSSTGSPTIEAYITLENTAGFKVKQLLNTMIVTEN
jgi:hypothetical protein